MSRLAFWRRAPCAGCGAESAPVDLLQLVDAQETALAELIEESHCAMRKLLQTHPIPENRTIDTARFSNRLNAQLEHLRVYMAEERSKLLVDGRGAKRVPHCRVPVASLAVEAAGMQVIRSQAVHIL